MQKLKFEKQYSGVQELLTLIAQGIGIAWIVVGFYLMFCLDWSMLWGK